MAGLFTPEIRTDEAAQARVREWVAALRSGKYAQGKSYLRLGDKFCCLGVACDLQKPILGEWRGVDNEEYMIDEVTAFLPERAQELYWLASEAGDYWTSEPRRLISLAGHNDAGWTFAEIADVIERELAEALA